MDCPGKQIDEANELQSNGASADEDEAVPQCQAAIKIYSHKSCMMSAGLKMAG